jgi:hypothetical protein
MAIKTIGEYIKGVQENDDIIIFDGLASWRNRWAQFQWAPDIIFIRGICFMEILFFM